MNRPHNGNSDQHQRRHAGEQQKDFSARGFGLYLPC